MPPIFNEQNRLSDWLGGETGEATPYYGRDSIMVVAGEDMRSGTVIGKLGSGEYAAWDPAASDGSQTAAGILVTDYLSGDTSTPQAAVGLFRGPAVIKEAGVLWPAAATPVQKTAARNALAANHLIFRESA